MTEITLELLKQAASKGWVYPTYPWPILAVKDAGSFMGQKQIKLVSRTTPSATHKGTFDSLYVYMFVDRLEKELKEYA